MKRTTLTIAIFLLGVGGIGRAQEAEEHRFELRLLGSHTFSSEFLHTPALNGGVEGAFRLTNAVSVVANYHHIASTFCFSWDNCTQPIIIGGRAFEQNQSQINYEAMGGVRLSLPNRSRIAPYVSGVAGAVNYSYGSAAHATPAAAIGAGVDYRLTPRLGLTTAAYRVLDVAPSFGGHTFAGYIRVDSGIYFRF